MEICGDCGVRQEDVWGCGGASEEGFIAFTDVQFRASYTGDHYQVST